MKANFFIPKYMIDFRCIGPYCTDTCCAGWDVNIDETTFNKYENSSEKLKELVKGKYFKNPNSEDPFNYGFMKITEDKKCPFLNEDLLCDIHGGCGEDNLSITCKRYPRVFNIIDDIYEKSGITSCEEVCRLALLNKDKMEFVEVEEELDEDTIEIRRFIDTEAFEGTDSLLQYFWDIRVISIGIMQNREFSIEDRLLILNGFYSKLESLKKEEQFDEIEEILDLISSGKFELIKYINNENLFTLSNSYCNEILNKELCDNLIGNRIKSLVTNLREIITDDFKNISNPNIIKKLEYNFSNYSYIIENYLVNQIFKDIIPFNKGENLNKSIDYLINLYKLIKSYIMLYSTYANVAISEKEILKVIQALSKDTEHNMVFKNILQY